MSVIEGEMRGDGWGEEEVVIRLDGSGEVYVGYGLGVELWYFWEDCIRFCEVYLV